MFISSPASRRFVAAAVVVALTALSACGGSDTTSAATTTTAPVDSLAVDNTSVDDTSVDSEASVATAELATYSIVSGDTLSGIAGRAGVSIDALIAANEWADGIDHLITPGDTINLPAGAVMPTSPSSSSTPVATDGSGEAETPGSGAYGPIETAIDFNDDRTAPVDAPLVDGIYYASSASANGSTVTLKLGQWFTCGDTGVAGNPTVECASGFGTLDDPSATVTVASDALVTVNTGDLTNFDKAGVTAAEFARLVGGQGPAAGAPAGYSYIDYPLFARVQNGVAVEVEQVYTS